MSRLDTEGGTGWVCADAARDAGSDGTLAGLWSIAWNPRPAHVLRALPGRLTFVWPDSAAPRWVIKRFERDAWRERIYELRHARRRSPAQRECESLRALAGLGLRVPKPLAWAARGSASFVLVEWVEHEDDLRAVLRASGPARWRKLGERLLAAVVTLHAAGFYHRDLYLQHWLVAAADELVLIDLGRARQERSPRRRWFEKDLAALLHSLPNAVPERARLRFLAGYLTARGIHERAERRSWARAIERRRAQMQAHTPRFGESPPPNGGRSERAGEAPA